jgi:hypothetical protein
LVRETQDAMALRLLVDLYHAQDLREDGGISPWIIRREFARVKVGERAQFTIWGFRSDGSQTIVRWADPTLPHRRGELTQEEKAAGENVGVDFFRRLFQLTDLGLLEMVPHLFESADESGQPIHPLSMGGSNSIEDQLGAAASAAACALLTDAQYDWVRANAIEILVPVPRHIARVEVIGIARLRYRPHTRMTAAWWADLTAKAEEHRLGYTKLIEKAQAQPAQSAPR